MALTIVPSVDITTNATEITLTGGVDASMVTSNTLVILNQTVFLPCTGGTAPDDSGNSTVTLSDPYLGADLSEVPLYFVNTNEGLSDAIRRAREAVELGQGADQLREFLTSTNASVDLIFKDANGAETTITTEPYGKLQPEARALITANNDGSLLDGGTF